MMSLNVDLENAPERGLFLLTLPVISTNSADPYQTPRSAASDLGLNCLPMSQH